MPTWMPDGRYRSSEISPTGSGSATISSSPRAIASIDRSVSVRRSTNAASCPAARAARYVLCVGGEQCAGFAPDRERPFARAPHSSRAWIGARDFTRRGAGGFADAAHVLGNGRRHREIVHDRILARARSPVPRLPSCPQRIDDVQEREAMEIGVARTDSRNPVLSHQHGRVRIMHLRCRPDPETEPAFGRQRLRDDRLGRGHRGPARRATTLRNPRQPRPRKADASRADRRHDTKEFLDDRPCQDTTRRRLFAGAPATLCKACGLRTTDRPRRRGSSCRRPARARPYRPSIASIERVAIGRIDQHHRRCRTSGSCRQADVRFGDAKQEQA